MTIRVLLGDVRERLRDLPADSFDCVVTSPPYWGLRDYGTGKWVGGDPHCDHRSPTMREGREEDRASQAGSVATNSHQLKLAHRSACGKCGAVKIDQQLGLEPTMAEHIAVMVDVFREVRRVLKPSGTLWVNYGDCYATSPNGRSAADTKALGNDDRTFRDKPFSTIGGTLKAKDLCMIPNRLAIALQDDGWWVRAENIWGKSNPMPESIRDRPATAHEKIFMLTKSARYFYAPDEVRQGAAESSMQRWAQDIDSQEGSHRANGGAKTNGTMKAVGGPRSKQDATAGAAGAAGASSGRRMSGFNARWDAKEKQRGHVRVHEGFRDDWDLRSKEEQQANGRSLRNYEPAPLSVWVMGTSPFSDAHFATFPPELVERCLEAGCPPKCCSKCGKPYNRKWSRDAAPPSVAPSELDRFGTGDAGTHRKIGGQYQKWLDEHPLTPEGGWVPVCECNAEPIVGRVLDPFGGAGTTALVADQMQLDATIIELNPDYVHIAVKRIEADRGAIQNALDPLLFDVA